MNRRATMGALALVGACALGACSSGTTPTGGPGVAGPTRSSIHPGPGGTPDALVGMWRVSGAAGEPADSVLRLSARDSFGLLLFRRCGEFSGAWAAATTGTFVGSVDGFSMACLKTVPRGDPTPAWLLSARAFRVRGSERELLAANGTVVAKLLPGGKPIPAPDLIKTLQQPPTLDRTTIQKLREVPRPLPKGATAATTTAIIGKWVPYPRRAYRNGHTPYLDFGTHGSWSASDGCNGSGGPWALAAGGELLSTSGASTLVGCDGAPTAAWLFHARRAAISGDVLTLYAADGKVLGRLTR